MDRGIVSRFWIVANQLAVRMDLFLERWPWGIAAPALFVLLLYGWWLAGQRELWFDEICSLISAQCREYSSVDMVRIGFDLSPPLFIQLQRWSVQLFGATEQGLRVHATVGMVVFLGCFFALLRHWAGAAVATIGLLYAAQGVYLHYLVEARAYGMMLACLGLTSLVWQREGGGRRWVYLLTLSLTASLAMCVHYYAVFGLVAIGAGQLGRDFSRRRLDVPVWLALVSSLWVLLLHKPLISGIGSIYGSMDTGKFFNREGTLDAVIGMYLYPGVGRMVVLLLVLLAIWRQVGPASGDEAGPERRPPLEAWTYLAGGIAMIGVALSVAAVTGMQFYPRYVLLSVAAAAGFVLLSAGWRRRLPVVVTMLMIAAGGPLLLRAMKAHAGRVAENRLPLAWVRHNVSSHFGPVLSSDIFAYIRLFHYGPAAGLPVVYGPLSKENEIRYRGDGGYFTTYMGIMARCRPDIPVLDWNQVRRGGKFQILRRQDDRQWLVVESQRLGAEIRLARAGDGWELLQVELPPSARQ